MKRVSKIFKDHAESAVRSTLWFNTVPDHLKSSLNVKILGVEMREGRSIMGDGVSGHCLIADVTCGEETRRFCWSLQLGDTIEID